jgi:protein phosphatase
MRNVLTMAIGASSPLSIHCYTVPMRQGATALICSDGLHGVVEAPRLEEIMRADGAQPLAEKARGLIDAARAGGGPDNVTVILLRAG